MCITPNILADGTEVGCRQCWQCRSLKVNSLVGRCIAESKYSAGVTTMTLTYAQRNDSIAGAKAVTIVYADVQQFLKNLRKEYKVRFICASEYGSKKGRAHHHIVLFWGKSTDGKTGKGYEYPDWEKEYNDFVKKWHKENNKKPPHERKAFPEVYKSGNCFHWPKWSHGHVHFENGIAHEKFAYAMKYTFKDMDQRSTKNELRMSLKPILGWEYFDALAQEYVEQGIKPKHWQYWFREFKDKYGKIRKYYMTRTLKQRFKEAVQKKWKEKYGKDWPHLGEPWGPKWGGDLQCDLFDYGSNDIEYTKQHAWPYIGHPDPKRPISHGAWGINIPEEIKGMWQVDDKKATYASPFKWEKKEKETIYTEGKIRGIDVTMAEDEDGITVAYNGQEGWQEWHDVPDAVIEEIQRSAKRKYQLQAET
jgi:hypothetical protein